MAEESVLRITTPAGRLVTGSVFEKRDKEEDGSPRLIKNGPNAGQPKISWDFGVAFPKTAGVGHWATDPQKGLVNGVQMPWLEAVWNFGHAVYPGLAQRPDFAWKIVDGDDTMPNTRNKKNADREGFPGHWVVYFSNMQAPQVLDYLNAKGAILTDPEMVKRGYWIQVMCEFKSNAPKNPTANHKAGLYANHQAAALLARDTVLQGERSDVNVAEAGFGVGVVLPAGVSAVPVAAMPPSPQAAPAPAPAPAPPAPVVPAHDLVAAGPVMTAKAAGVPYADFIAKGWTDAAMREQGYLV